jgi:hypothetical protein
MELRDDHTYHDTIGILNDEMISILGKGLIGFIR